MKRFLKQLFCHHKWIRHEQFSYGWKRTFKERVIPSCIGQTFTCEKCEKTRTQWKKEN